MLNNTFIISHFTLFLEGVGVGAGNRNEIARKKLFCNKTLTKHQNRLNTQTILLLYFYFLEELKLLYFVSFIKVWLILYCKGGNYQAGGGNRTGFWVQSSNLCTKNFISWHTCQRLYLCLRYDSRYVHSLVTHLTLGYNVKTYVTPFLFRKPN